MAWVLEISKKAQLLTVVFLMSCVRVPMLKGLKIKLY